MLLDLPGHSLKKRLSCQLCFQAGFLSLNGVLHPRQELLRPAGMNRMAVRAAIPLHPQSLGKPDKLPKNEAMPPQPYASTLGTTFRFFPVELLPKRLKFFQNYPTNK
jgi:hypothetical protein